MRRYNDYQLIYLIKGENCECALELMFNKYAPLIKKNLYLYNIRPMYHEDYYQEAIILLYKAIMVFDEIHGKTFMRFYELILKRKFFQLMRKNPKYELHEDFHVYQDNNPYVGEIVIENLTDLEEDVFKRYFIENQKISFIAEQCDKSAKQIYNAIYRIRNKYKKNML